MTYLALNVALGAASTCFAHTFALLSRADVPERDNCANDHVAVAPDNCSRHMFQLGCVRAMHATVHVAATKDGGEASAEGSRLLFCPEQ